MDIGKKDSWELLAFVRFSLAFIVMISHLSEHAVQPWMKQIFALGAFSAVLGFLVLSGYSIGHSYSRNSAHFYGRRLARIYPLYAMAILYTIICLTLTHDGRIDQNIKLGVGNLLFLQTYHFVPMTGNGALWSLAVEATCYLLTPWFARTKTATLLGITAVSAIAFAVFRIFMQRITLT